jgi:DNA processing protein
MDELNYWLALNKVKGIGAVRFRALLEAFGTAQQAWEATPNKLIEAGIGQTVLNNFLSTREKIDVERVADELNDYQLKAFTLEDENYPRRLRELSEAPPVLFVRGHLLPEDEWAVAIVGTRRVTSYGQQVAEELATFLAHNRITVVSGLARGVDAIAHRAALKAGGRTIGVTAHGLDMVYPQEHRKLAEEMSAQGALVSDYAIGTPPDSVNFPPRNRIISGLSMAVVIIEAGFESGALITAGFAAEQGREVFALPGPIYAPQSKGCNLLIQRGAHPLLKFEDLMDALDLQMMSAHKTARVALPTDAIEAKLFGLLGQEPLHVNDIGIKAALPIEQVSSTLALMELKGLVRQVGSMNYVAARESQSEYRIDASN